MSDKFDEILSRYATGKTTPEEEKFLLREAIGNQDAFDDLADEEMLRTLLEDPVSRAVLLQATAPAEAPTWRSKLAAWFRPQTAALGLAGVIAVAALIAVVIRTGQDGSLKALSGIAPLPARSAGLVAALVGAKSLSPVALEIVPSRPTYQVGDRLRLKLRCDVPADLLLLGIGDDGAIRLLYPNQWHPSAAAPPGEITVPGVSGAAFRVDGSPGKLHFILAAFRPGSGAEARLRAGERLPESLAATSVDVDVRPK